MKSILICAFAFVALAHRQGGIHARLHPQTQIHDASPYKRLLRTRSIGGPKICEPESTKMEDCNGCFCVADGSAWACTDMACNSSPVGVAQGVDVSESRSEEDHTTHHVKREANVEPGLARICEPGSQEMQDCNRCFCVETGRAWACTRIGCFHPINGLRKPEVSITPSSSNDPAQQV